MSLSDVGADDLIDELEFRGYVVIDGGEYRDVLDSITSWRNGGKALNSS